MASSTTTLGMILPGFGEYVSSWWEPINDNFTKVDDSVTAILTTLQDAAAGSTSLADRLTVALEDNGTLKDVPAVLEAQNTFLYGFIVTGTTAYTLKQQMDNLGTELWNAREGASTVKDAFAAREFAFPNQLVSGLANGNGYPTYAGFTGANVRIDGSTTPLKLMIGGYMGQVRTLKSQVLSGAAGTYFVYATRQATGVVVVDGSVSVAGITSNDVNAQPCLFTDTSVDFTLQDVRAGDYLTLLNSSDIGSFRIKTVAPGGNANQLQIIGNFPVGGQSGINYTVSDRQAVSFSAVLSSGSAPANSIVIAEADFDGVAVTAVRPRAYKNDFVGEWRAVTVAGPSLLAEQIYTHYLGTDKLDVAVQISQANDGSAPVEEMDLGQLSSTLAVSITNTMALALAALGTLTPSTGTLAGAPANSLAHALATGGTPSPNPESLSGSVTAALTGAMVASRGVALKWDRNSAYVKGLVSGVLYTDYTGTVRTTGYLRVVARRRG